MPALSHIPYTRPVPLELEHKGSTYKGIGIPVTSACTNGVCNELAITLNDKYLGVIYRKNNRWRMDRIDDQALVDAIGERIQLWYE